MRFSLRSFRAGRKGAALVEFALGATLFIVVLLATLEFGIEIYARHTTDRVANRATLAYASTGDLAVVEDVIAARTDSILARCLGPVDIRLFDSVASTSPLRAGGREATGGVGDDTATAFRLSLTCDWPRITPALGGLLGSVGAYTATGFARIRPEVTP